MQFKPDNLEEELNCPKCKEVFGVEQILLHSGHYCKLAAFINHEEIQSSLSEIIITGSEKQRTRARYMLEYLINKKHTVNNN